MLVIDGNRFYNLNFQTEIGHEETTMGCQCSQNVDEHGNEIVSIDRTSHMSAQKAPQIGSGDLDSARKRSGRDFSPVKAASAISSKFNVCVVSKSD